MAAFDPFLPLASLSVDNAREQYPTATEAMRLRAAVVKSSNVTPPDLTERILALVRACGLTANRNDQAIVAMKLCISEGVDTRNHIVASLARARFRGGHAAAILDGCEGPFPESHHWRLGADGRYTLHEEDEALDD